MSDLPLECAGLYPMGGDGIVGDDGEGDDTELDSGYDPVLSVELPDARFPASAGGDAFPGLEGPSGE